MAKFNKEFWQWFGESKVVDRNGSPKLVYHSGSFDESVDGAFDTANGVHFGTEEAALERVVGKQIEDAGTNATVYKEGRKFYLDENEWPNAPEKGFTSEKAARTWARKAMDDYLVYVGDATDEYNLTVAYLSIQRPKRVKDKKTNWAKTIETAIRQGYDGLVYRNEHEDAGSDSYVIFHPNQVKSVNNRGTWNPGDENVLHGLW